MRWVLMLASCSLAWAQDPVVSRALDYLSREVPAWKKKNGCFSCHNNGDAARALMLGGRREALTETLAWLEKPEGWDHQQADAEFRDKDLARVQFAFALTEAVERGFAPRGRALTDAAAMLAKMQAADGGWAVDKDANVGSPATYGSALATYAAIRVLKAAGGHEERVRQAEAWLAGLKASSTPDLAAKVLALRRAEDVAKLQAMQNPDGGWGPYRASPSEVFDTALAMLALPGVERGKAWLVKNQLPDGGWEGTTRPSGNISYAQHISTTGWATLALLQTGR
ncbi:MAG: prenyltransferase/squalene oxidase repeat-containing protein [Bryobacteraceae bacterium]